MTADELQIYDWVLKDSTTVQVDAITIDSAWYHGDCFGPKPISLTDEILKANGLEEFNYKEFIFPGYSFVIKKMVYDFLVFDDVEIHYVHELQHALRLCGLPELANNFKIV